MREQLELRLCELRQEQTRGEALLAEAEARRSAIREMLLRLNGAIQVLDEELNRSREPVQPLPSSL